MKTKRLLNIFILSSLVTIAACTEEETGDEGVVTTLRASIEQKAETKTHLSGPEITSTRHSGRRMTPSVCSPAVSIHLSLS